MIVAGLVLLVAAVPGWGYWQALSHADLHVSLHDVALRNERQAYGDVRDADLVFMDAAGTVLARGSADSRMVHPQVGDCRREEREGGTAWQQCFDAQSRWLMTWVRRASHATVRVGACAIDKVPVRIEESRDAWWLWWLPHPHIDNSTRTHFDMAMSIDSAICSPADR